MKLELPRKSFANVSSTSSFEKFEKEETAQWRCLSPKSKQDLDTKASTTGSTEKRRHKTPKAGKQTDALFTNYR